jgi:hypothetical protein
VTPKPFIYESLKGFILRVSEENGYPTPSFIAKLLGPQILVFQKNGFPADNFASILGISPSHLDRYSYKLAGSNIPNQFKILEHSLPRGGLLRKADIEAKFCPICAKEDGYIDAFWDLGIALACPRHSINPLSRCHECNIALSWNRPGINKCGCGADYSEAPLRKSESSHVELMAIVYAKLHGNSLLNLPNKSQFPLIHFEKLSLGQLLLMINKFGTMAKFYEFGDDHAHSKDKSTHAEKALKVSACIFSNWPYDYAKFLHRYFRDVDNLGRRIPQSTQLNKLLSEFSGRKYQSSSTNFLTNELLLFSSTELEFPKPTNVRSPYKIRALMNKLSYKKEFELAIIEDCNACIGEKILKLEEAADYVGLPENVMELFWSSGVMKNYLISEKSKSMKFPWAKEVIDEILQTIKNRKIRGYLRSSVRNESYIFLDQIMQNETLRDELKVSILNDIFKEKIKIYGRVGKKLSGLFLKKSEIKKYISTKNKAYESVSMPFAQAANFLCTNEFGVKFLIQLGYLSYIEVENEKRIPTAYLRQFEERLITVKKLAESYNQPFNKFLELVAQLDIQTIFLPGVDEKAHSLFLPRFFEKRIKDYFCRPDN